MMKGELMRLRYFVLDVFSDRVFGGNPLAVVFDGEQLDDATMQSIAAEFNLSETVFVLPPTVPQATHRVRIFTPRAEVPFAGHPSVGSAFLLASLGECDLSVAEPAIVLQEQIGNVVVRVFSEQGRVVSTRMSVPQMPARVAATIDAEALAAMLSLEPHDLHPVIAPQAWSCGIAFLYVPVRDIAAARRAVLRLDLWERQLQQQAACNVYVLAFEAELPGAHIHARMFAPAFGVFEDPATGSAAAALAGLLAAEFPEGRTQWLIEQGVELGRASRLALEYQRAASGLDSVQVGGPSVRVAEGVIQL